MGNRTAKFISAIFASVLLGAPVAAVSQTAPATPNAADDCLAAPKGAAPQGQHWHYRVERGTKRQCWYLREEGPKAAQAAQQGAPQDAGQSAQAAPSAPAAASPSPSRAVQDARAEWTSQQTPSAPSAPNQDTIAAQRTAAPPATTPRGNAATDGNAQAPAVASRWPDAPTASPSPAPQAATTTVADAAPTPESAVSPAPEPVTQQAAADVPVGKPAGSLQMLLLVVGGALALAGITGSVIYRFAGSRVRVSTTDGPRRRVNWDNWERELEQARAPWLEAPKAATPSRPRPADPGFALYRESKPAPAAPHPVAAVIQTNESAATSTPADATALAFEVAVEQTEVREALPGEAPDAYAGDSDAAADNDDGIDIDAITAILERLAKEGPQLSPSAPATGPAAFAQSRQVRSGVRA